MIFTGAKQRVFEESPNLRKSRILRNMFLHSNFYTSYSRQKYLLNNLRNRNKNLWEDKRFLFSRENNKMYSRGNNFFQGFYLYRLKRFLNFFKFFLYNRYSNNFNSVVYKDFNRILVEYNRFFNKDSNVSFFGHLFQDNFNLSYNFSYIKKEKLKLRTIYNIKKYKSFIKKIQLFFNNNGSDFNRLLVNYLEFQLSILVYRSKFVNSIYSSEQLIKHGFFEVDGKVVKKPGFHLSLNETVQLIPTYSLYLKKQKLDFLLQSFLSWYSGFYFWFNKRSNFLDNFYSLLFCKFFIRNKNNIFLKRFETSSENLFDSFNDNFNTNINLINSGISNIVFDYNKINFSKNSLLKEVFSIILPNLRLVYRSFLKNYLLLNNKFFFTAGSSSINNLVFARNLASVVPFISNLNISSVVYSNNNNNKVFSQKRKMTSKLKNIIFKSKFMFSFRGTMKNLLKSRLYFNIYFRNRFDFTLYSLVNKRNYGFNSYSVKYNSFGLPLNMNKVKLLDTFNVDFDELISETRDKFNAVNSNSVVSTTFFNGLTPLQNVQVLAFFSKENVFLDSYYSLLVKLFNFNNIVSLSNINKLINLLLNRNFISNILFPSLNNKNYYFNLYENSIENVTSSNIDLFYKKNSNSYSGEIFNFYNKNSSIKLNSFSSISNLFKMNLGHLNKYYLILQNYLNRINVIKLKEFSFVKLNLPINKVKSFNLIDSKWLYNNKINFNYSNKNYGFSVSYDLFDWLKLRNLNLRFKKFIIYFFYLENISLLKDFSSYKKRNKSVIFEYKMKFHSINYYFIDKFYLILLNKDGKTSVFFYPKVFSNKYYYRNKYINIYNNLFMDYKKQVLHNQIASLNNNSIILNYYLFYKEFKYFKYKLGLVNEVSRIRENFSFDSKLLYKLFILFFEIINLSLNSVENKALLDYLAKIMIYFNSFFSGLEFNIFNQNKLNTTNIVFDKSIRFFSSNLSMDSKISYDLYIQLKNFPLLMSNLVKALNIVPSYIEIDYELNTVVISYFPFTSEVPFVNLVDIKSLSNVFKSSSRY